MKEKELLHEQFSGLGVHQESQALPRIHIEVCVQNNCAPLPKVDTLRPVLRQFIDTAQAVYNNTTLDTRSLIDVCGCSILKLLVCKHGAPTGQIIYLTDWEKVTIHVYRICGQETPFAEQLELEKCEGQENNVAAFNHWTVPNHEFEGIWESLIFDSDIKERLLSYMKVLLLYSDRNVDDRYVCANRMILLHGPPGTGKTTLSKALAQKLCIRMSNRYRAGQFIEVNSHSLFSKYFSESGKLVQKLFGKIHELVQDPDVLVIVLVDEVESLTVARKSSFAGNEPSDAIRVVNAVLTQIDSLKRYPNVLIMATSNMLEAIDGAFVDRADIKQFVGLPSAAAIYEMLQDSMNALVRAGIIKGFGSFMDVRQLENCLHNKGETQHASYILHRIAKKASDLGYSGRTLRKLPVVAHASFLEDKELVEKEQFLMALDKAVEDNCRERALLTKI